MITFQSHPCSACWLHACFLKFFYVWLPGASDVVPAFPLICHTVQHLPGEVSAGLGRGLAGARLSHHAIHTVSPTAVCAQGADCSAVAPCLSFLQGGVSRLIHKIRAFQGVKGNKRCCFQRSTVNLISTTSAGHSVKNRMCDFQSVFCQSLFYLLYYVFKHTFQAWEMYKKIISNY